jgi:micrococcal nuclease
MCRRPSSSIRAALVGLIALATACTPTLDLPDGANGEVVGHVDGDTLDIAFSVEGRAVIERVRLIGIDTPETKKPNTPIECFGPEASARLAELLPIGAFVVADRDVEARDDFGRLLAYVRRANDDVLVNEVLVREGFARTLFFAPNLALESTLRAAERSARADRRGLWSACP